MDGKPARHDGVLALNQGAQNRRGQRLGVLGPGGYGCVGLDEKVAHLPGPLFLVDVDERLEFAQMMSVAQAMPDAGQSVR